MLTAATTRFRVKKTVATPAIGGSAGDIESLASHATNPAAHPDYLKKVALPRPFAGAAHLSSPTAHAVNNTRRAELALTKSDYEKTKLTQLANNAENYSSNNPKRHIITSFVLNQILTDLGLLDNSNFVWWSSVVTTGTRVPTENLDNYVPSFGLFYPIFQRVNAWAGPGGIADTYLTIKAAQETYVDLETFSQHTHDVMTLLGMPNATRYMRSTDATYLVGKSYYTWDLTTHQMQLVDPESYTPGDPIPSEPVLFEEVASESAVHDLSEKIGYTLTGDTTFKEGTTYYEWDGYNRRMKVATVVIDAPVPENRYYIRIGDMTAISLEAARLANASLAQINKAIEDYLTSPTSAVQQAIAQIGDRVDASVRAHFDMIDVPDWTSVIDIPMVFNENGYWTFTIPESEDERMLRGTFIISAAINVTANEYARVSVVDMNETYGDDPSSWKQLFCILPFHTYNPSSENQVAYICMPTVRVRSNTMFIIEIVTQSTGARRAAKTTDVYSFTPATAKFVPDFDTY